MRTRGRPRHPDILTPREWEVLSLIERGASNEEIAQRLGITERTAKYHVSEILSKLGVSSRAEAAGAIGERPPARVRSGWSILLRFGLIAAAGAVLTGVGILAVGVLKGTGDADEPQLVSFADVYGRLTESATKDGKVLHIQSHVTYPDGSNPPSTEDLWADASADTLRAINTNSGMVAVHAGGDDQIISDGYVYWGDDFQNYRGGAVTCPENNSVVIGRLLRCSDAFDAIVETGAVNANSSWQGSAAIEVTFRLLYVNPAHPEQTLFERPMKAYLDPETYLPIATQQQIDDGPSNMKEVRYTYEFIDRSKLAADFFDPHSIGYPLRDSDLKVAEVNQHNPVYWFGEGVPATDGFPDLALDKIIPDDEFRQEQLHYRVPENDHDVSIAYWSPDAFTARLGELKDLFLSDPACSTETTVTTNGYTAHLFTMPETNNPNNFRSPGSCSARMLSTQVFNYQPRSNYFVYIERPDVVIELRAWPDGEYDSPEGVQALLERLRPFTP